MLDSEVGGTQVTPCETMEKGHFTMTISQPRQTPMTIEGQIQHTDMHACRQHVSLSETPQAWIKRGTRGEHVVASGASNWRTLAHTGNDADQYWRARAYKGPCTVRMQVKLFGLGRVLLLVVREQVGLKTLLKQVGVINSLIGSNVEVPI